MNDLISVIVPVYNIEDYIEQCVLSICNQTYQNLEIILVDDGSIDRSGVLCDSLAETDQRIKVLHKENKGNATARRDGVNYSNGQYIGFVDGDDWIEPNMYENLYQFAVEYNAEMVTSAGYREYLQGVGSVLLADNLPEGVYDMSDPSNLLLNNIFPVGFNKKYATNGAIWNKLYKRDIICDVVNCFEDNFTIFEDNVINIAAILQASRVYIQQKPFYHHRERNNSITYGSNEHAYEHLSKAYYYLKKIIEESVHKEILWKQLDEYIIHHIFYCIPFFLGGRYSIPTYVFDTRLFSPGSKILLYGAGTIGQQYRKWIDILNIYQVVKWVDKNNYTGVDVVESIMEVEFDYVLIAVKQESVAEEIKKELCDYGIQERKIIWKPPVSFANFFVRKNTVRQKELYYKE